MSCKIITIFSNKGGVGKTFISANIAAALAMKAKKVLLLDLNLQAGQDLARSLNISAPHALADLLPEIGKEDKTDFLRGFVVKHVSGVDFLSGINHLRQAGLVTGDNVRMFLKKVMPQYEYIIVDGGGMFSEVLISVLDQSNLIFLPTTPDVLAVYQSKSTLEMLQALHYPLRMIKIILNRAESRGGVAWQEVKTALPCDIFALIPSDGKTVGSALNRGVPCVLDSPKAKVSELFFGMADKLQDEDMFVQVSDVVKVRANDPKNKKDAEFWGKVWY